MQRRIVEYTATTFAQAIGETSSPPLLVHFGTDWCPPCKRLERVLAELLPDLGDTVKVGKINVEDEPDLARSFEVTRNPTVCLFRAGELVARREGFADRPQLIAFLETLQPPA